MGLPFVSRPVEPLPPHDAHVILGISVTFLIVDSRSDKVSALVLDEWPVRNARHDYHAVSRAGRIHSWPVMEPRPSISIGVLICSQTAGTL